MTPKEIIKSWFSHGKRPTASQFTEWIDSYWHKEEKLNIDNVNGLSIALASKTSQKDLDLTLAGIDNNLDEVNAFKIAAKNSSFGSNSALYEIAMNLPSMLYSHLDKVKVYTSSGKRIDEYKMGDDYKAHTVCFDLLGPKDSYYKVLLPLELEPGMFELLKTYLHKAIVGVNPVRKTNDSSTAPEDLHMASCKSINLPEERLILITQDYAQTKRLYGKLHSGYKYEPKNVYMEEMGSVPPYVLNKAYSQLVDNEGLFGLVHAYRASLISKEDYRDAFFERFPSSCLSSAMINMNQSDQKIYIGFIFQRVDDLVRSFQLSGSSDLPISIYLPKQEILAALKKDLNID